MGEHTEIGEAVARTVRSLRSARGWSLDRLAGRAGVSKGVLVALEQGRGNPNLGTLVRIAGALGVPLARLVRMEVEPPVRLFPPERQVTLWRGPGGGYGALLAGNEDRPSVELWRWELAPGDARESDAHAAGTREIVYVEEGTLTLVVDGINHPVPVGVAAVLTGDRPHSYVNGEPETCRFVLTVLDP